MAVTATQIDGNNVALVYGGGSIFADVFTLNTTTGAVTSSYLSVDWCRILAKNAVKLFAVTTLAQRATAGFLDRLVAIGSLDGTTITTTAVGAGTVALRVTVNANTTVLVQLPHSIFGAASLGQSVPATGGGGGGSVVADDLGLVRWTATIDPSVFLGALVGVDPSTGVLTLATPNPISPVACLGVYEPDSSSNDCIRVAGEVAANGGPFTPGAVIYMGETAFPPFGGGIAVEISPTTPGSYRQVVGYGTASGDLFVQPGFVEVV